MLAVPVMAKPTNGPNKVAVEVIMERNDVYVDPPVANTHTWTGPIRHTHSIQGYDITITITGELAPLTGIAIIERNFVRLPQKDGYKIIFQDRYVFTFSSEGGGFEGNGNLIIEVGWAQSKAYGLFHGTGAYEGQTLNIGHTWASFVGTPAPWYGYWLKR
jgi:hypothetical protein